MRPTEVKKTYNDTLYQKFLIQDVHCTADVIGLFLSLDAERTQQMVPLGVSEPRHIQVSR